MESLFTRGALSGGLLGSLESAVPIWDNTWLGRKSVTRYLMVLATLSALLPRG